MFVKIINNATDNMKDVFQSAFNITKKMNDSMISRGIRKKQKNQSTHFSQFRHHKLLILDNCVNGVLDP